MLLSIFSPKVIVSPRVTAAKYSTEWWSCNQEGKSPESISGPFNRTPYRKGFNLLIRKAQESERLPQRSGEAM